MNGNRNKVKKIKRLKNYKKLYIFGEQSVPLQPYSQFSSSLSNSAISSSTKVL